MIGCKSTIWLVFCGVLVFAFSLSSFGALADKYPGDIGIESDPNVVFVENFEEGSIPAITARYDDIKRSDIMSLVSEIPAESSGLASLLMTHTGGDGSGGHLYTRLLPGYDQLYFRFYTKFDVACHPLHHFVRIGGYNPPYSYPNPFGGAGELPSGDESFSAAIETHGSFWRWDFYTYWMEMRNDPYNDYWGNDFINDSSFTVEQGEWICVEEMVKMNDPTTGRNGEMAVWVNGQPWYKDGQLVSHLGEGFPNGSWSWDSWHPNPGGSPFQGFRWRSIEDLKLNFLWLSLYITTAPNGHVSKVWFDDIVIATEYIGPLNDVYCDLDDANFFDYAVFASYWMDDNCVGPEWCECADFDRSGTVDLDDLGQFGQYWQQARRVFYESGGSVAFEVEHYTSKADGSGAAAGASWVELTGNGSSGDGYVQALPDSGLAIDTNIEAESPHLSYDVEFTTPGTYYLWLRCWSDDFFSQFVHYGLDGSATSSGILDAAVLGHDDAFTWRSFILSGSGRPTLTVNSAGRHKLDLWMREDGAKIDRILLTTDAGFIPSD